MVYVFDKTTGVAQGSFDGGNHGLDVSYDAAGNIYTADSYDELTRIFSPPGANNFTSQSWFSLDLTGPAQTLTINVTPPGTGTTTGAGLYFAGQSATVTALEAEGYKFQKWTDESGATTLSTSESYTFEMPSSDLTINAVFVTSTQRRLSLVSVPAEGAATLTGGGMYEPGTSVPVATTPNTLWTFLKWTSDEAGNNVVSTNASFNYTIPGNTTTLYAQYRADEIRRSPQRCPGGGRNSTRPTAAVRSRTSLRSRLGPTRPPATSY